MGMKIMFVTCVVMKTTSLRFSSKYVENMAGNSFLWWTYRCTKTRIW